MVQFRRILVAGTIAAVGLAATGSLVHAEFIKRSGLIKACTGRATTDISDCAGYIAGVADLAQVPPGGVKPEVCIAKVPLKLVRESVTTYLQSHPGADGPAAPAVYEALTTLYKC